MRYGPLRLASARCDSLDISRPFAKGERDMGSSQQAGGEPREMRDMGSLRAGRGERGCVPPKQAPSTAAAGTAALPPERKG